MTPGLAFMSCVDGRGGMLSRAITKFFGDLLLRVIGVALSLLSAAVLYGLTGNATAAAIMWIILWTVIGLLVKANSNSQARESRSS